MCKLKQLLLRDNQYAYLAKRGKLDQSAYKSFKLALSSGSALTEEWLKAYREEIDKLENIEGLKLVRYTAGMHTIPFMEVLTCKVDPITKSRQPKVRLAVRGDLLHSEVSFYSRVTSMT